MADNKPRGTTFCQTCGASVAEMRNEPWRKIERLTQTYYSADPRRRERAAMLRAANLARADL